jgi:hypothetical protein
MYSEIFELSDYYETKVAEQQAILEKENAVVKEETKRSLEESPVTKKEEPVTKKVKINQQEQCV